MTTKPKIKFAKMAECPLCKIISIRVEDDGSGRCPECEKTYSAEQLKGR